MTIFMDRDGCIVGHLGDYKCNSPSNYQNETMPLIMPTIDKLAGLKEDLVIISNQGGVGKYIAEELVIAQFKWLHEQLRYFGVNVIGSYFCPDQGDSARFVLRNGEIAKYKKGSRSWLNSNFRKPDTGMGRLAQDAHGHPSVYVGDLSGNPSYAPDCHNPASDKQFAYFMGWEYLDIQDFLKQ